MRSLALTVLALLPLSGCVRHVVMPPPTGWVEPAREEPPQGMVETEIVSHYGDQVWDVYANGSVVCTTPCTQWLSYGQGIVMRSRDGDEVFVPGLGREALEARRSLLVAEGSCSGKQTNGIVWTSLGGMGLIVATTLTAIGCSDGDLPGMCRAGLITGGVTLPLTAFGIWMLVDSNPKAHVLPMFRTRVAGGQPPLTIAVAPNGIGGTF